MKHITWLLILANSFLPPGNGHAMSIEQMKKLRGADMLELRVSEIFTQCGLPDAIIDRGESSSIKSNIQWDNITMKLSDGNWDLLYRNNYDTGNKNPVSGWINPNPAKSPCFPDLSLVTLFTEGGAGILTIDKIKHKTTYIVPENPYKAHKVIGSRVSLTTPISLVEITKTYGRYYDTVNNRNTIKIIRFWIVVESSQMPIALYAVDFEINNVDNTCKNYRIATSNYDFVRRKFEEFSKAWDKYGID